MNTDPAYWVFATGFALSYDHELTEGPYCIDCAASIVAAATSDDTDTIECNDDGEHFHHAHCIEITTFDDHELQAMADESLANDVNGHPVRCIGTDCESDPMAYPHAPLRFMPDNASSEDIGTMRLQITSDGRNGEQRPVYRYVITDTDTGRQWFGNDLSDGVGASMNSERALVTLASFLAADAETYRHYMGQPLPTWHDGYLFGASCAELAYQNADDLSVFVADAEDTDDTDY